MTTALIMELSENYKTGDGLDNVLTPCGRVQQVALQCFLPSLH